MASLVYLIQIPIDLLARVVKLASVKSFGGYTSARFASQHRKICAADNTPRCSEENLKKTGCDNDKKAAEQHAKTLSMWYNPACCTEPCFGAPPRFDELYYKMSDKAKRYYMQTWKECPKIRYARKPLCKFEKIEAQEIAMKKRCPKTEKPKTACAPAETELMQCSKVVYSKCPKLTLPGCRPVRSPPTCTWVIKRTGCKKICTPYPSFSECKRKRPKPLRPVECKCLQTPEMCEVWEMLRKKYIKGKLRG